MIQSNKNTNKYFLIPNSNYTYYRCMSLFDMRKIFYQN